MRRLALDFSLVAIFLLTLPMTALASKRNNDPNVTLQDCHAFRVAAAQSQGQSGFYTPFSKGQAMACRTLTHDAAQSHTDASTQNDYAFFNAILTTGAVTRDMFADLEPASTPAITPPASADTTTDSTRLTLKGFSLGESFDVASGRFSPEEKSKCLAAMPAYVVWENSLKRVPDGHTPLEPLPATTPDFGCKDWYKMQGETNEQRNGSVLCNDTGSPCKGFWGGLSFSEGKVSRVDVILPSWQDGIASATAKYGEPTETYTEDVQNNYGARFQLQNAVWRTQDAVVEVEQEYTDGQIKTSAVLETPRVYAARHPAVNKHALD